MISIPSKRSTESDFDSEGRLCVLHPYRGKEGTHVQDLVLGDDRSRDQRPVRGQHSRPWRLAAYGDTDKDAVAHVTELARESVQVASVEVERGAAWPTLPYVISA